MLNALMVGTGEYTTGFVHGSAAQSDKKVGVVALTLFDLRRRGIVNRLLMAGTNGTKFPAIRKHLVDNVAVKYNSLSVDFDSYPSDETAADTEAYKAAIDDLESGDVVVVFTPDDSHFGIAMEAVNHGCHVLIAKPIVKTVDEHKQLATAATKNGCLVAMEVHKRWDPIYRDARDRIAQLGDFSFFQSYMSQPKSQLETFRSWAGKSSDISFYLNAHHIDFNVWAVSQLARPIRVFASATTGIATSSGLDTEDTITLTVDWKNNSGNQATAVYTASWAAPKSDVHSQQRFFYMGHQGEITIDQAHRGYSIATDAEGYASPNPLFMKYTPGTNGEFCGQDTYGYRSIEDFVQAADKIKRAEAKPEEFRGQLATVHDTIAVTAILEAGRRSLDSGRPVQIDYENKQISGLSID